MGADLGSPAPQEAGDGITRPDRGALPGRHLLAAARPVRLQRAEPRPRAGGPQQRLLARYRPPRRDIFSRTLYSIRTTVIVTTAVILSGSLIIGNTLGLLAGYRGGWVDGVIMRAGEVF